MSIIIPVYNGENTIRRAIDSAISQHFDDSEILVVNDGSTDGTASVLKHYGSKIRVIDQPNRGPAAARNVGVASARGRYLAFLDADDVWLPGRLAKCLFALEKSPSAVLSYCDYYWSEAEEGELRLGSCGPSPSHRQMLLDNVGIFPSITTVRRNPFEKCGGFYEGFSRPSCEDSFLWIVLREQGHFEHIPEPLVEYHCQPIIERALKWEPGRALFESLLRQRYGAAAKPMIKQVRRFYGFYILQAGVQRLDNGSPRDGLRLIALALRIRPMLLSNFPAYALNPKNLRRLSRLVVYKSSPSA